jgi:hypothetical protein
MAMTGTPSIAASSMSEMHSPVLPLPVIPTQTACVTRSRAVVEDRRLEDRAGLEVVFAAEVEEAEFLEVVHGGMLADAEGTEWVLEAPVPTAASVPPSTQASTGTDRIG